MTCKYASSVSVHAFASAYLCLLRLNAKVNVASSAANNAAYGRVFVYVTLNGTELL